MNVSRKVGIVFNVNQEGCFKDARWLEVMNVRYERKAEVIDVHRLGKRSISLLKMATKAVAIKKRHHEKKYKMVTDNVLIKVKSC